MTSEISDKVEHDQTFFQLKLKVNIMVGYKELTMFNAKVKCKEGTISILNTIYCWIGAQNMYFVLLFGGYGRLVYMILVSAPGPMGLIGVDWDDVGPRGIGD